MNNELQSIERLVAELREQILIGKINFVGNEDFTVRCCGNVSDLLKTKITLDQFAEMKMEKVYIRERGGLYFIIDLLSPYISLQVCNLFH